MIQQSSGSSDAQSTTSQLSQADLCDDQASNHSEAANRDELGNHNFLTDL